VRNSLRQSAEFPWPTSRIDSSAKAILRDGLGRESEIAENELLGVGLAEAGAGQEPDSRRQLELDRFGQDRLAEPNPPPGIPAWDDGLDHPFGVAPVSPGHSVDATGRAL
jgi:hypothetical protein